MKSLQSTGQIYILKHNQDLQSNCAPIYEFGWPLAVNLEGLHFCEVWDFIFVKFKTLMFSGAYKSLKNQTHLILLWYSSLMVLLIS